MIEYTEKDGIINVIEKNENGLIHLHMSVIDKTLEQVKADMENPDTEVYKRWQWLKHG